MLTLVPTVPVAGVKLAIRGATVKLEALVAVPPGVVTLSVPLVALAGTVVVIWVLVTTCNAAAIPLNRAAGAPVKLAPAIVTLAPTAPLVGVNPVMRGATVKLPVLVPVPT